MARSTVGFGRAVGRSQAIRPAVTFGNLNTPALRPPPRWWQVSSVSSTAEPETGGSVTDDRAAEVRATGAVQSGDSRRQAGQRRGEAGATGRTPGGESRSSTPRSGSGPHTVPTPTWTDRLVPSSRFERQRREAAEPGQVRRSAQAAPAARDVVSTGDRKLDALKLMLDAGYTPANAPREMLPGAGKRPATVSPIHESTPAGAADETGTADWDPSRRRGDTTAGRETAPGGLARLLLPEPVDGPASGRRPSRVSEQEPGASPPSAPGPIDVPAARESHQRTHVRGHATPRRTGGGAKRQETLRRMLAERGETLYDPRTGDPTDGPAAPWPGDIAVERAAPSDAGRSAPRDAPTPDAPAPHPPASEAPAPSRPSSGDRGVTARTPHPTESPHSDALMARPMPASGRSGDLRLHRMITDRTLPASSRDVTSIAAADLALSVAIAEPGRPALRAKVAWSAPALPSREPTGTERPLRRVTLPRAMSRVHRPPVRRVPAKDAAIPTAPAIDRGDAADAIAQRPPVPADRHLDARGDQATDWGRYPLAARPSSGTARPHVRAVDPRRPVADGRGDLVGEHPVAPPAANLHRVDELAVERPPARTGGKQEPRNQTATPLTPPIGRVSTQRLVDIDRASERAAARPVAPSTPVSRSIVAPGSGALRAVLRRATDPTTDVDAPTAPPDTRTAADITTRTDAPTAPPDTRTAADITTRTDAPTAPPDTRTAADITTRTDAPGRDGVDQVSVGRPPAMPAAVQPPAAGRAARKAAAAIVAEQFLAELSQSVRSQPAPLPMPFRPMAEAITGSDRVLLSTDVGSRRALRSVGKRAATTGNVIHLDRTPRPGRTINEVIAHELTHVANPSPAPRFFDDIDDSPEERRAESVARIMARSPLAPTSGFVAPVRRADVVRRAPAQGGTNMVTADSAASRLAGTGAVPRSPAAASGSEPTIRRLATAAPAAAPTPAAAASPGTTETPAGSVFDSREAREWFERELDRNIDMIMERIEDRVRIGLERRGGRFWREI